MFRVVCASVMVLAACQPAGSDAPVSSAVTGATESPLEAQFAAAGREFQVPVSILKAVAWVGTRASWEAGITGPGGTVGLMQLTPERQRRGAALTGVDVGRLAVDSAANIRAAAAVLRELFDDTATRATLHAIEPGDWYPAVSMYPQYPQAEVATGFASDVFQVVERGFEITRNGRTLMSLPVAAQWQRHAPAVSIRRDGLGDYPGSVGFAQSPNYSAGRSSYDFVVIHTMQGSYAGSKSWFLNAASNVSAHYIVRSSDGQITQMVSDSDTAWHAQCYNGRSIGIEHEGYIAQPSTWYTDAMYTESAKLTAWLCTTHNIAKDRTHIIGHAEVAPNCNTNGHTDPGSGWNWTKYMSLIGSGSSGGTTGTLIGAIYTGGNTSNRVQGAVVTLNGMTVTTGADGLYQFQVAPGSYTPTVTKSGFTSNSITRTVTANTQTWGSMEINPGTATGTLSGKVYAYNTNNPADTSLLISGATVSVNGQMATTASDGLFSFTLPAGTYTLQVSKTGYTTSSSTRTVSGSATTTADTGLTSSSSSDVVPPTIAFTFPQAMARLDLAQVQLKGDASDDRGAIASVKIAINGGAELDVPVTNGQFTLDAQLAPGMNQIVARAVDAAGNPGTATLTCTFAAGVGGKVFDQQNPATAISGATVELRAPGAATPLQTKTTGADGRYDFDVTTVGDVLLTVKASGFRSSSQTITISALERLAVDVGLVAGQDTGDGQSVTIVDPMNGAVVMTDTVTVYGSVSGFDVAEVKVNGVRAELIGAGGFSATIPLVAGVNDITAVARGMATQSASTSIQVTRTDMTQPQKVDGVVGFVGCSVGEGPLLLGALAWLVMRRHQARA